MQGQQLQDQLEGKGTVVSAVNYNIFNYKLINKLIPHHHFMQVLWHRLKSATSVCLLSLH